MDNGPASRFMAHKVTLDNVSNANLYVLGILQKYLLYLGRNAINLRMK